ncbi:MAG: ABC transporter ATP-binding protein [Burkholderiaceae bacterium]|nr:ABC transporter ATP-binding protein [Burkholderiaceae bacterium]
MASAIAIHSLSVRFQTDFPVIENFSLNVPNGQFISIVGPSGCGKTTLLNLLTGMLPFEEGSITIAGSSPVIGNPDIAYMLARDSLLPWRSALGNAYYGMELRGVSKQERKARALNLLKRVGLKDFENAWPKTLSQGMRQRVALARTFALTSPVLLMDEPFAALDAQTKLQLEDLTLELWENEHRTVLFVTHDLAEAVALSDRIIVMSKRPGRIIADIPIPLPRPRTVQALHKDHDFHQIYVRVWEKLQEGLGEDADQK